MASPLSNEAARLAADEIRSDAMRIRESYQAPKVGIILGSGLGGLAKDVVDRVTIPYATIPGFPNVAVGGHDGELVLGALVDVPVAILSGRFHLYEGHSAQLAAFPVRVLRALGADTLFVSNAAGGINRDFAPGDLMVIDDHLNLTGTSPLVGSLDSEDVRFPDMSDPYDAELRDKLHDAAASLSLSLKRGVYAGLLGPSYETRAEIRMLATLGADAVGMSTVCEVIAARALGMRVAGVSCITNMAAGIQTTPLDHAEVLATSSRVASQFQALVRRFVAAV